ncbi:unnamed protein product, partial [Timema podura]|nr:unnamed protein product [Timema podura]
MKGQKAALQKIAQTDGLFTQTTDVKPKQRLEPTYRGTHIPEKAQQWSIFSGQKNILPSHLFRMHLSLAMDEADRIELVTMCNGCNEVDWIELVQDRD